MHFVTERADAKIRQCGKCGLHRSHKIFEFKVWKTLGVDLADAIMFLESGEDIVVDGIGAAIYPYVDGQCWPNIQHLPHRRSTGADKLEIQATWC
jgi:hypothetical protein